MKQCVSVSTGGQTGLSQSKWHIKQHRSVSASHPSAENFARGLYIIASKNAFCGDIRARQK